MTAYAPYPAYRFSDVDWLGEIPAHWDQRRLKFVAPPATTKLNEKPDDKLYLGLENIEPGTGRLLIDSPTENVESTVTLFQSGDVLFGKLRPYLAKVVHTDFDGVCTGELMVLRPINNLIHGRFLFYSLLSHGFINLVDSMTYGAKMPRANPNHVVNLGMSLPPLAEQRAIAAFLDRETVWLDTLIAKKRELIDLLHKQRTAIISHAVTKGLDPHAPLKSSGVEWLGDVPAHWEVNLVKRFFQIDLGKMLDTSRQKEEAGEIKPYLRAANIFWEGIRLDDIKEMRFSKEQLKRYRLQRGDLLVTEGGVTVGRSAIWREEIEECYYQNSINRVRQKKGIPVKFLYYWLYFLKLNGFIEIMAEKATFGHLTKEKLETTPISVPSESEARTIIQYLDNKLQHIEEIITQIDESIRLLQKQRTALISAAVTGKIDVRSQEPA